MPLRGELKMAAERLVAFGPEIWVADGPVVQFQGFPFPTRMAVIRLGDGGLFVWSPIALTPGLQATIDALGPVRYLVAPNKLHNLFLAEWKAAYPWALLFAAPGLTRHRRDLVFDEKLMERPHPGWASEIDQVFVQGSNALTEVVFLHRASGTALVADLIQDLPAERRKGWRGLLGGRSAEAGIGTPPALRATFTHKKAVKQAVERILGWGAGRLILAHGPLVEHDATAFIAKALAWAVE
jgi:hypothetical protein